MTERERKLVMLLVPIGIFVVLGGGFLAVTNVLDKLGQKDTDIDHLQVEISKNQTKLTQLTLAQKKWDRWKQISFPPDVATANNRYHAYLQDLSRKHKLEIRGLSDGVARAAARGTAFTQLRYSMEVDGTLAQLLAFMKEYYSVNFPHQIRDLELAATNKGTGADLRLNAKFKFEAMSLPNIEARDFLPAIPDKNLLRLDLLSGMFRFPTTGLAVGLWNLGPAGVHGGDKRLASAFYPARDYARLSNKNIFVGLAPKTAATAKAATADENILKFVQLTDINGDSLRREAGLYNKKTNKQIRLRAQSGMDTFTVRDANGLVILNGQVKQIAQRDVIFLTDGKHFNLHVGQTLHDAMLKELNDDQVKKLAKN